MAWAALCEFYPGYTFEAIRRLTVTEYDALVQWRAKSIKAREG